MTYRICDLCIQNSVTMGLEDPTALENLRMDKAFVVDPELRPKRKHDDYLASGNHVPVIDLSPLRDLDEKLSTQVNTDLIEQVGKACEEWGFFQVVNHGVPISLLDELEAVTHEFFNLPREEKLKVPHHRMYCIHIYVDDEMNFDQM